MPLGLGTQTEGGWRMNAGNALTGPTLNQSVNSPEALGLSGQAIHWLIQKLLQSNPNGGQPPQNINGHRTVGGAPPMPMGPVAPPPSPPSPFLMQNNAMQAPTNGGAYGGQVNLGGPPTPPGGAFKPKPSPLAQAINTSSAPKPQPNIFEGALANESKPAAPMGAMKDPQALMQQPPPGQSPATMGAMDSPPPPPQMPSVDPSLAGGGPPPLDLPSSPSPQMAMGGMPGGGNGMNPANGMNAMQQPQGSDVMSIIHRLLQMHGH